MNAGKFLSFLCVAIGGVALSLAAGCSSADGPRPAAQAPAPQLTLTPVLASGDQIELKFFYDNELNVTQTIRPDGKITLELVGEVPAAGMTPTALATDLKDRYTQYLKHPDIAVFLRSSNQRKVYVDGAVLQPRILDMPDKMTVLEAIMAAGGFNLLTADTKQIIVMRDDGHNGRIAYQLSLADTMKGKASAGFVLAPKDIVYVPRTFIVDLDQFVLQYIGGLVPDGLIYTKTFSGGATIGVQTTYNAGVSP